LATGLKVGGNLTSYFMRIFVLIMAASFILSTILGVVMAFKHGRRRRAPLYCLAFGVAFPLALILMAMLK
jgi:formate/nitrite transporter FocA (FNT family)